MIRFNHLEYSFSDDHTLQFPNWATEKGKHALILGKSGSGKTTLLHLLGGLLSPTTGEIFMSDTAIHSLKGHKLDKFRGKNFGFVFQKPHLISSLTVFENLKLTAYLSHVSVPDLEIHELLGSLDLERIANRMPHQISQGQAQRVSIARAVVNRPKVVFADEPTASLDDESCDRVLHLLLDQADQHQSTLIMATHDHRVKSSFSNQLML